MIYTSDLNNAMKDFLAEMTPSFHLLLLLLLSSREASGSQPTCGRLVEVGQDLPGVVPGKVE